MNRFWVLLACVAPFVPGVASATPRDCLPGFVAVADTNTCVKVSGRVRAEFVTGRASGTGGALRSQGRIGLDARTQTSYGPLRTVVRVRTGQDGF